MLFRSTNNTGAHTHGICIGDDDSQQVSTMGNTNTHQNCGWFNTASAGNHSHGFNTNNTGGHSHGFNTNNTGGHSHNVTGTSGSTGNSGTDKNLPPYYALCYIMKT